MYYIRPVRKGKFNEVLQSTRMNIYQRSDAQGLFAQLSVFTPSLFKIINEANGSDDLLITAMQMRYKNLRAWLARVPERAEWGRHTGYFRPSQIMRLGKVSRSQYGRRDSGRGQLCRWVSRTCSPKRL